MDDDTMYVLTLKPRRTIERELARELHDRLPDEDAQLISFLGEDGTLRISYHR